MYMLAFILVTLVVLAVTAGRFGAESRDGFDGPVARARGSGR